MHYLHNFNIDILYNYFKIYLQLFTHNYLSALYINIIYKINNISDFSNTQASGICLNICN